MTLTENLGALADRKLPTAFIIAIVLQTAGALFWAGSAAERLTVLEKNSVSIADVAVLKEQTASIRQSLARIEAKLEAQE